MGFGTYLKELHRLGARDLGNLVILDRTRSTNGLARRIAAEYHQEGVAVERAWIVAYGQSEGRGRRDRSWISHPGAGVYATLLLPLEEAASTPEALATLPLLVASALCETIDHELDEISCQLKWPNDLMVEDAKVGGILIEVTSGEGGDKVAVIGLGVNLVSWELNQVEQPTTALADHLHDPPTLARLTVELLSAVDARLERLGDVAYAIERYQGYSLHAPGDRLVHRAGEQTLEGIFRGFDPRGFLRLEVEGQERLLSAGEIVDP